MNYTLYGFTFAFTEDGDGNVTTITTPPINVGPVMVLPSEVLTFDPALTVAGAEAVVYGILTTLGITG